MNINIICMNNAYKVD